MCNLAKYLEEKELECRRIAYTHVSNSPQQIEWADCALKIQRMNLEHIERCAVCQANLPKVAA